MSDSTDHPPVERPRRTVRFAAIALAAAVFTIVLVILLPRFAISLLIGSESTVVRNESSSTVTVRQFSFGDSPEPSSPTWSLGPGDEVEIDCGFLRELDVADELGVSLPVFVKCPSDEAIVITEEDLRVR